jgi:erythritol transport system ATP-binding protein
VSVVLEAREVSKQYPGTLALNRVTFQLHAGKVSALIGENGAGKSTLVKILAGVERPTDGALFMDGAEIVRESVRDADRFGIGMIHQELNLCPNLSVAENIFLSRELTSRGMLQPRQQEDEARLLLERLEHPIDPGALAGDLPLGQQQIVEIAKALARDVRVLMMDEPTSALSPAEIEALFRIIRELTASGVAVVYISHRLEELLEIADSVTVLRDGRKVAEAPAAQVDVRWIVEMMTGRPAGAQESTPGAVEGATLLRAERLSSVLNGRFAFQDVTFSLHAGEVLGVYGLMGAGRTELLECLIGVRPLASGRVWLGRDRIESLDTGARVAAGLAMAPEDRQTSGLVQPFSIRANMTLASLRRFTKRWWLSPKREQAAAAEAATRLRIRTPGLDHNIGSLSGGNQQKVLIARCVLTRPRVLLHDEPTRGDDIAAKREIHSIVRELAASGMGIILVSSELEEVRAVSDRILAMSRGEITGEFRASEATDDALARAASGYVVRTNGEPQ